MCVYVMQISLTKINNAKWRVVITLPGDCPLPTDDTAKLLRQPLFFSTLQATHESMLVNVKPEANLWGFVKNRFSTDFLLTGNIQPMFYKFKATEEDTLQSLQGKILLHE